MQANGYLGSPPVATTLTLMDMQYVYTAGRTTGGSLSRERTRPARVAARTRAFCRPRAHGCAWKRDLSAFRSGRLVRLRDQEQGFLGLRRRRDQGLAANCTASSPHLTPEMVSYPQILPTRLNSFASVLPKRYAVQFSMISFSTSRPRMQTARRQPARGPCCDRAP